jgi:hypothetical protein
LNFPFYQEDYVMQNPLLFEKLANQNHNEMIKLAAEFRLAAQAIESTRPQPKSPRPRPRWEIHILKWVLTLTEASHLDPCLGDLADR